MFDRQTGQRLAMTATGALAGLSFHVLSAAMDRAILPERLLLLLSAWALVFFIGVLGMAGRLRLTRAALLAAGHGLVVALLLGWASLRFANLQDLFHGPVPVLAGLVLTFVPLPFLVAHHTNHWRDYPALFSEAWAIAIRFAAAALFVGLVWLVLLLSSLLLKMVGIALIDKLMGDPLFGLMLSGAMLGLGIAVVDELSDVVSPYLVLRLLRLLLPVLLVVLAVFLLALPLRGVDQLFGTLSAAATLLTIAAAGATLITAAVDQAEDLASRSRIIRGSARAMAVLILLPASLGAWAVALRVAQYGWTPARIFAACIALLGLGYGLGYLLAVLRGRGWPERIRQTNVVMALATVALSALALSPALNPERISAASQFGRLESGRISPDQLDLAALADWGHAGSAARAALEARARQPGQAALAARLANDDRPATTGTGAQSVADIRGRLAARLPVRPAGDAAFRDAVIASLDEWELTSWTDSCAAELPGGGAPCVMLSGAFWPGTTGRQAIVLLRQGDGWLQAEGFSMTDGQLRRRDVVRSAGALPTGDAGADTLRQLQARDPRIAPAGINALKLDDGEVFVLP